MPLFRISKRLAPSQNVDNYAVLAYTTLISLALSWNILFLNAIAAFSLVSLLYIYRNRLEKFTLAPLVLLAALPSVPASITFPIVLFVVFTGFVFLNIIFQPNSRILRADHTFWPLSLSVLSFLILIFLPLNFFVGSSHFGVDYFSWGRGLIPFLFTLSSIPIAFGFLSKPELLFLHPLYICSAGFVHSISTAHSFISYKLWENSSWLYSGNAWRLFSGFTEDLIGQPYQVFDTRLRVSLIQPNATSLFVILLLTVSSFIFVFLAKRKLTSFLSLLFCSLSSAVLIMSYTRSMIGLSILSILLFISCFLFVSPRQYYSRLLSVISFILMILVFATHIYGFQDLLLGRYISMSSLISSIKSKAVVCDSESVNCTSQEDANANANANVDVDANIASRLDEFKAAFSLFHKSPILGAGLGVKYTVERQVSGTTISKSPTAYTHNIISYTLMTGGIIGFLILSYLWVFAFWTIVRIAFLYPNLKYLLALEAIMLFIALLYSQFFAIFRLPLYNLYLGSVLGMCAALLLFHRSSSRYSGINLISDIIAQS